MVEIQIILLLTTIVLGFFILYKTHNNSIYSINYKHPSDAIGVGPISTESPSINYMYVWHDKDAKRLRMEFRNLPGVTVSADDRIIQELSEALKKI